MILTDRDFGRAYLTESDGWARRFLVDLFANYTVLFVGYSHKDTIMTYLTPSLPLGDGQKRFALIGDQSDDPVHWRRMGIDPIAFHQEDASDYSRLDKVVTKLADFKRRGVLEWKSDITTIARGYPPIDEESSGIIEHALTDQVTTRFFVESAELPEWVEWLDRQGRLDRLFTDGDLEDRHAMLSRWLASRLVAEHSDALFSVIARHGGKLNPHLWTEIAWQLGASDNALPDKRIISRWVHFLVSCVPPNLDELWLSGLAQTCAKVGAFQNLLQVYDVIMAPGLQVRPASEWDSFGHRLHSTQSLWNECLKPNLSFIGHSLLERTTKRLEERRSAVVAWGEGNDTWDGDSFSRSAIEPHEQDNVPQNMDTLIDVARGCLEWLTANDPIAVGVWCNRFAGSDTPLLRRLAIHATNARNDLIADDKIGWLLEQCDVNEFLAHHEIFRTTALAYPQAGSRQRKALIQAVSEYQAPESRDYDSDELSALHHFNCLHWLHQAAPDCSIVKEALDAVQARHPEFGPSEHPDFTHWSEALTITSQWNPDMLLARPAADILQELLTYQPTDEDAFQGNDRRALLRAVNEAAQSNQSWGLDLADGLAQRQLWNSDIWHHLITAWANDGLDQDSVRRVLSHLSTSDLHQQHAREIARVLSKLTRNAALAETKALSYAAHSIAIALRPHAAASSILNITSSVGGVPQYVTWLNNAVNHASGELAQFWTFSIELWRRQQEVVPVSLNAEYRDALDTIIIAEGIPGQFGRTVLASQFHFFFAADEKWTVDNLLPLFNSHHDDFQCAWDGFLTWGRLSPAIAELLREKFITAIPRVVEEFEKRMSTRFLEFYATALGWLISSADDDWITKFFRHADENAKSQFACAIEHSLRYLDESSQQEWWNTWLKDYWKNRLQGVPNTLDDVEIAGMLEWVLHLPGVFPEAVDMAVRMRTTPLSRSSVLYNINEGDLIERYPNELANFLLHLGKSEVQPWFWHRTKDAVDKLLEQNLQPDLDKGIRELIVRHSLN